MDFAKAFDKVPHMRLLYKLDYYGIRGTTHKWINSFPSMNLQQVFDSQASLQSMSCSASRSKGRAYPGPISYFINDLPDNTMQVFCSIFR